MWINITTGTEGPKMDPYGYTEIRVENKGHVTVLHRGLATWLLHDDEIVTVPNLYAESFLECTGITPAQAERYFQRAHHRCKVCGCKRTKPMRGYPGETLNVCVRCGEIVSADFSRRSIE